MQSVILLFVVYAFFVLFFTTYSLLAGGLFQSDSEGNLYNYMLFCHATLHDYERSRELYIKALKRMEWRGPDLPFVLYAYSIYAFVTHDQDYSDILMLLERARKAEELRYAMLRKKEGLKELKFEEGNFKYGKVFELATVGFFRHNAVEQDDGESVSMTVFFVMSLIQMINSILYLFNSGIITPRCDSLFSMISTVASTPSWLPLKKIR